MSNKRLQPECTVTDCEYIVKFNDITKKHENMKLQYNEMMARLENIEKDLSEEGDLKEGSKKKIIHENLKLRRDLNVTKIRRDELEEQLDKSREETEFLNEEIQKKEKETLDLKTTYELDKETTMKRTELDEATNKVNLKSNEMRQLEKHYNDTYLKYQKLVAEYNAYADNYNRLYDYHKQLSEAIAKLETQLGKYKKKDRIQAGVELPNKKSKRLFSKK